MALGLGVGTLWALLALLGRAEQPPGPVTVTAAIGADVCLPCGTRAWGELLGVSLNCTLRVDGHGTIPVLSLPVDGPGPPLEPPEHFRGRVAFCPAGTGGAGVSLLLRNLSQDDFGNYSCYDSRAKDPLLLCSVYLRLGGAEAPRDAEPVMVTVVCVLSAFVILLDIGVLLWAIGRDHCWGRRARGSAQEPGAVAGREQAEVALDDLGGPEEAEPLRPPAAVQALV